MSKFNKLGIVSVSAELDRCKFRIGDKVRRSVRSPVGTIIGISLLDERGNPLEQPVYTVDWGFTRDKEDRLGAATEGEEGK